MTSEAPKVRPDRGRERIDHFLLFVERVWPTDDTLVTWSLDLRENGLDADLDEVRHRVRATLGGDRVELRTRTEFIETLDEPPFYFGSISASAEQVDEAGLLALLDEIAEEAAAELDGSYHLGREARATSARWRLDQKLFRSASSRVERVGQIPGAGAPWTFRFKVIHEEADLYSIQRVDRYEVELRDPYGLIGVRRWSNPVVR